MMRLAVSNIAWSPPERDAAHAVLAEHGVTGLEIAPGLTFPDEPDPVAPSSAAIADWQAALASRGLKIVSMQSLLFGVTDARLFGTPSEREAFERGIGRAVDLAARIGCPNLVLGSPTARVVPVAMAREEAERTAVDTLRRLGDRCLAAGTLLALEPNPAAYGTNFLNTFAEAAAFAAIVDHPGVTVNFDIGALLMNAESQAAIADLPRVVSRISHVHISEPQLAPAPADPTVLRPVLGALARASYGRWASIEMRAQGLDNLDQLRTSLDRVRTALPETVR